MNRSFSSPEAIVVPKASVTAWSQLAGTLAICCLLVTLAGCGPRGPDVQMVEGTITLDGAPLADAQVTFIPLSADGLGAVGLTREDGGYVLNAMKGKKYGQGTLQGEYAVMVRKMIPDPRDSENSIFGSPEQYAVQESSPLRATVVKGRNRFDFALSSKGSGPKAAK